MTFLCSVHAMQPYSYVHYSPIQITMIYSSWEGKSSFDFSGILSLYVRIGSIQEFLFLKKASNIL